MTRKFKCTDGFVTKVLEAESAREAAELYAIVPSCVEVVELDKHGDEIGEAETIKIE